VYEGYGQTEAMVLTVTDKNDAFASGTVGGPAPSTKFRLKDLPEMNYMSTDKPNPRGELQFWGITNFQGYYKNPERTAEAFTEDGWINSGDVAEILPNGNIKIIDRAKNIFKLAQGEYVAPEKLENIYVQCSLIAQIFVHGDSVQSYLVAVIVPDPEVLQKWIQTNAEECAPLMHDKASFAELSPQHKQEFLESKIFSKAILQEMDAKGTEYKLSGIERVKKIHVTTQQFSPQNDLVTPTFKLKRFNAKLFFKAQIEEMYSEGAI
jgi:long-chain acyl-CoA synthetase